MISVPATNTYPACTSPKSEHDCPWGGSTNGCARKSPLPWGCSQKWIACDRNKQTNKPYIGKISRHDYSPIKIGFPIFSLSSGSFLRSVWIRWEIWGGGGIQNFVDLGFYWSYRNVSPINFFVFKRSVHWCCFWWPQRNTFCYFFYWKC